MELIAALPMYNWPELRFERTYFWTELRDRLRAAGVDAPDGLVRRNADMPAVPGGIRDASGRVIARDPASLPPDALDLDVLWRHPSLLLGETCWGPLALGLAPQVQVVGQTDYTSILGGRGPWYRSALVMRRRDALGPMAPVGAGANVPVDRLQGRVFTYNDVASRSGYGALEADLRALGHDLGLFDACRVSGSHRASLHLVARGEADVAAIDCRSWAMAQEHEPVARELVVVGWTMERLGLPFVCSRSLPLDIVDVVAAILMERGEHPPIASVIELDQ